MQDGDKNPNITTKVLSKDGKNITTTLQAQPTFRSIGGQPMRVVTIPPSSSGTQIIQTMMPNVQTMIKPVDNRISVSRPVTPTSYHIQRNPTVTSIQAPRGSTPIRTPTPPASVTNITPNFVRTSGSPRAPSSSGTATLISQAPNWISSQGAVQVQVPTQLIRANITQSPRPARVVTQTIPQNSGTNTITANVVTQQTVQGNNQTVHGTNVIGTNNQTITGQQAFVATLSLPPRQQGAALVYSQVSQANQNQNYQQTTQRLAVATSIAGQRQVRPIQRLPTTGIGVRVSTANLSIRQNVPVLATIPSAAQTRTTTISSTNLAQIPARILQPGGTTQVVRNVGTNVMTLQPIIVQNNRIPHSVKAQIPQALTIAHVGKISTTPTTTGGGSSAATITVTNLPPNNQQNQSTNLNNQQLTASIVSGTVLNSQGQIQTQKSPQIAHILSVNQPGVQQSVQQHQIINAQGQSNTGSQQQNLPGKGLPLVTVSVGNVVQANVIRSITTLTANRDAPIAKVLPRQQVIDTQGQTIQQSSQGGTSVFIHTTPPNANNQQQTPVSSSTATGLPNTFISSQPTKFIYDHLPTTSNVTVSSSSLIDSMFSIAQKSVSKATSSTSSTITPFVSTQSNNSGEISSSGGSTVISSSVSYTPSGSSFAVVPTSNRQIHVSSSSINQLSNQIQAVPVPVRFNPQLIVDDNQTHGGAQIITMSSSNQIASIQPAQNLSQTTTSQPPQQQQQQTQSQTIKGPSQTHLMIPATVTKVDSPRPLLQTSNNSNQRKREADSSPVRPTKVIAISSASVGLGGGQGQQTITSQAQITPIKIDERPISPHSRPPSTDGSTTVSATSSPTLDQQEQEERAAIELGNRMSDFFNSTPTTSSGRGMHGHHNSTGGNRVEPSPRKKIKRNL